MELTDLQYQYLEGTIGRYRLTISEQYKVWNDDDFNRAIVVREQLGITDPITKFCSQCGIEYTISIFEPLNQLMKQYELAHV